MQDLSIIAVPLLAGVLVLLSHVPLGEQVLGRGIVFIDLAIAQAAALGLLVGGSTADSAVLEWLSGCVAALVAAGAVAWLSRRWPARREALIGLVYVGTACIALLWVSADPRGAQKMSSMLAGDVLWANGRDLAPLALATVPFLAIQLRWPDRWADGRWFYPAFAVLVSLSVPLLGLFLVFASLIVPALVLAARPDWGRHRAIALGAAAYAGGLLASLMLDLPSGPCVVLGLVAVAVLVAGGGRAGATPSR